MEPLFQSFQLKNLSDAHLLNK